MGFLRSKIAACKLRLQAGILAFGSNPAMPRPQVISFRLAPDEHFRLTAAAEAGGISPSVWCRRLVLEQLAGGPPAAAAPAARAPFVDAAAPASPVLEPLSRVVAAKLTDTQYFDLEARAKGAGVTVGTYLRRLVQGQPPTSRWPLARAAIVQLSKVGANLNQLVKLAHQGAPWSHELTSAVESVLAQVRSLRQALQVESRE
jgi:mobilization protein NikA